MPQVPQPRTWVVGDTVSAARLNALRDAINFLLNPPMFAGYQATAQSIPNLTETAVIIDTVTQDSATGYNVSTPTRYTAQYSGWYEVVGKVNFNSTASGFRAVSFHVNGNAVVPNPQANEPTSGGVNNIEPVAVGTVYLNAGDYVELTAYQNTGAAVPLTAPYSTFTARWVHA